MFLSEWHEFVIEIARVAWHTSLHPLQQEKTCNSVHEQTPLSNDTIDSVQRHREVGRAKDLISNRRTEMHARATSITEPKYNSSLSSA